MGIYDASYGLLLKGESDNNFTPLNADESGLKLNGEVKDFLKINIDGIEHIIVARNNDKPVIFQKWQISKIYSLPQNVLL